MEGFAECFDTLCRDTDIVSVEREGIGVYKEKRIHRIIKRAVTEDESAHEVKVGTRVADVLTGGEITEVQTGSFRPLTEKLKYYLENTDYKITVIMPVIAQKTVIRIDPETGELLRKRRSPTRGGYFDMLYELYYLREIYPNDRLTVRVLLIDAEEYRYSERIRYRREGAYDAELFPTKLEECRDFCTLDDVSRIMPTFDGEFTVKEFAKRTGLKERKASMILSLCMTLGLLCRRKDGKRFLYSTISDA